MLKDLRRAAGWLIAASLVPVVWGQGPDTATPIKYIVVIFQENNSFDHYFGTYPNALFPNGQPVSPQYPAGESPFVPLPNTPSVNGLSPFLNNLNAVAPFRLDRSQALTCDNDNGYTAEQVAYNSGQINQFPSTSGTGTDPNGNPCTPDLSMGYYDGNTVTALWNYAQYFAMSDNFFDTEFGVTEEGHQNLIAGQTHTATVPPAAISSGKVVNGSIIMNVEAGVDDCVVASGTSKIPVVMTSTNIGDLLSNGGISWGWFYGDFPESGSSTPITSTQCGMTPSGNTYNSHYSPFMYYATTSNRHHLSPSSPAAIGTSADQANHNYSLVDFQNALNAGNLPSVTFLKAPTTETGHPANSTPLEEQTFLVDTINMLQQTSFWPQMAIIITYDDSDGWYDHVMPPIVNQSNDTTLSTAAGYTNNTNDIVAGSLLCGTPQAGAYLDRCGYGTRLPLLVISPYAKQNYVDHALTDTTSVLRFIEDNWNLGRLGNQSFDVLAGSLDGLFDFTDTPQPGRELILDDQTGTVVTAP
jgi:phospholipase C